MEKSDQEIIYSRSVKAGKRIYYLDVKKSRQNDFFLSITESKKIISTNEPTQWTFEKHKIFLYQEDMEKFLEGLQEVVDFIKQNQKKETIVPTLDKALNIDNDIVE